jgi:uncharacterized repeat protein (TIGR01451 family)
MRLAPLLAFVGSSALHAIPASADTSTSAGPLQVTQSTSGPAVVGQELTYTISVTNTNGSLASGVQLGDTPPKGLLLDTLLGPGGNPDLCARTKQNAFSCSMGDLAPGASASLTFSGPVPKGSGPLSSTAVAQGCTGLSAALVAGVPCATSGGVFVTISDVLQSPVVPSVPTATAPGAPTGVSASAGDASATVSWTAPASDGGSLITSYTVTATPSRPTTATVSPVVAVSAPATSAVMPGLTNGTAYTFSVTATNGVGTSPVSAASNSVTPTPPVNVGVPGVPTRVAATAGSASATIRWTPPASNGGSPITGYSVAVVSINGVAPTTAITASGGATATSATLIGLVGGSSYTFSVTANNAIGSSAPSAVSNPVVPTSAVPQSTTTDVQVTGRASSSSVAPSAPLTYTFDVKNTGQRIAQQVAFTAPLGAGVTLVSASPACVVQGGKLTCALGDIAAGVDVQVTLTVTAPPTVGALAQQANIAWANENVAQSIKGGKITAQVTVQVR